MSKRDIFSGNELLPTPSKWLDVTYRVSDYFGSFFPEQNTVAGVAHF